MVSRFADNVRDNAPTIILQLAGTVLMFGIGWGLFQGRLSTAERDLAGLKSDVSNSAAHADNLFTAGSARVETLAEANTKDQNRQDITIADIQRTATSADLTAHDLATRLGAEHDNVIRVQEENKRIEEKLDDQKRSIDDVKLILQRTPIH